MNKWILNEKCFLVQEEHVQEEHVQEEQVHFDSGTPWIGMEWNFKHYIVHREEYILIHWQFYILYSDEIAGNESQFLLIYIGQLDIFSIGYCQLLLEFRQQTVASNRKVAIIRTIASS